MHDSVQRDAVCVRDLNIASSEYRTDGIDLGRANSSAVWTTLLLLNFFAGMVARSDAPGMRPVADSILTSGTHSWKENGHEKKFYDQYLPSADSRKGSCQLLAK